MTVTASLPMRWCSALALAATAAALTTPRAAGEEPFPVTARLVGGPHAYTAGAGAREFRVELANRSREPLRDVHPVLVFVDRGRKLTADQILLEYEVTTARSAGGEQDRAWRPVSVEHTDNDENIAVVGGENGPGTTLPPGRAVAIALRLRFTARTPAGRVRASATIMERRGRDGDWVGESAGYDFDVVPPRTGTAGPQSPRPDLPGGGETGGDGGTPTAPGAGPGTEGGGRPSAGPAGSPAPDTSPGAGPGTGPGKGTGPGPGTGPGKGDEGGAGPGPELAATGSRHRAPALMLTGAGMLLVAGGAALRFSRRG
ncbi:hypothetical protein [Streptomyces sp. NPDC026673]|uniref:hypothetical protein n=1 Tax=Streptomyces sp. NPDC026673 TaxID=3155724 RepID=UPI0033DADE24